MASNKDKGDDTAREGPWVELKRQVNLMSDVANIVGFMVGCGSFMSQQGILGETGRVGMSLIMWVLCASLAMTGALCYAGTLIPKSGGDYSDLKEAFGQLGEFLVFLGLFAWTFLLIINPFFVSKTSLFFGTYIVEPFFGEWAEDSTSLAIKLFAALSISIIIQQAVFKGSRIGAPVTTAITLLPQFPVSFSVQQGRKHHLGKLLGCIVILLSCLPICQGMAILEGNPAKFSCRVADLETSLFQAQRPDGTFEAFAQGGTVYPQYKEKFQLEIHNELSGSNTSYFQTFTLKNATVDDDGQYRCEEEGEIRNSTSLTVERTPDLHLKINDNTVTTTNIDVVLNEEVAIECTAEGGKPPVKLSWRVNGEEKNLRVENPPSSPERVNSTIYFFPAMEDKTLTCVASGQKVTPQINVSVGLNIQYLPDCNLEITNGLNAYNLKCSCSANPEVKKYEIYMNGSLISNERKTNLSLENPAIVYCNATNDVGSFPTHQEDLKPFHGNVPVQESNITRILGLGLAGFSVVVMVILAVFGATVCYCLKKREEAEHRADRNHDIAVAGAEIAQRKTQELSMQQTPERVPLTERNSEQDCETNGL